ncbi:unnamed protein product [Notodromas monacha]|uniref:Protein kinase domain-containing protein n=1 Tax=Notodromas monacha TaxID=399045 RepID=A0A7R9BN37_9CRUS|nr:unnamed protein product [Notodromas monacha]CAG0918228.1 unnamed protein product [Notodromas monacha]
MPQLLGLAWHVADVQSARGSNPRQPKWSPWEFPREKLKLLNVIGEGHFGQNPFHVFYEDCELSWSDSPKISSTGNIPTMQISSLEGVWKAEADGICGFEEICTVAVKTVKPGCATEREKRDLLRELKLMEQLSPHPNIVALIGCCSQYEPYYLIMEYVVHGKLLTYLRDARKKQSYYNLGKDTWSSIPDGHQGFGPGVPRGWSDQLIHSESGSWSDIQIPAEDRGEVLSSRDLTRFAYQISRGMEYLSSKGIIHRDLAARNVLVDRNKVCKIADFGLSRHVSSGDSEFYEQKTRVSNVFLLTYEILFLSKFRVWSRGALPIRWMAPESLYVSIFTTKSDVWSFGVVLWEIVTLGSTPYPGMSAREVMRRVREGYRLERPKHCKSELYRIITRCWLHDPTKRPEFTELCDELANLLESHTGYVDLENFPCDEYYDLHDDARSTGEKI